MNDIFLKELIVDIIKTSDCITNLIGPYTIINQSQRDQIVCLLLDRLSSKATVIHGMLESKKS